MNPSLDVPSPIGSALPVPSSIPTHNPERLPLMRSPRPDTAGEQQRCLPGSHHAAQSPVAVTVPNPLRYRAGTRAPGIDRSGTPLRSSTNQSLVRPQWVGSAENVPEASGPISAASFHRPASYWPARRRGRRRCQHVCAGAWVTLARAGRVAAPLASPLCRHPGGSGDVIPLPSPWRPGPAWRGGLSPSSGVFPAPRDPGVPLASPVIRRTGDPLPGRARGRVSRRAGVPGHGMGWQHWRGGSAVGSRVRPIPPELGRGPGAPCCSGGKKLPGGTSGVGRRGAKFSLCFESELGDGLGQPA